MLFIPPFTNSKGWPMLGLPALLAAPPFYFILEL
jgi:hypothetical protein